MAIAHRVFQRYLDQRTSRQVAARLLWSMSRDQAKRVLQLPSRGEPTDVEINVAYQALVRDAIRRNPGAAADQEELKQLNIAKDTLRGQFDRKDPGKGPNAPEPPGSAPPPSSRVREKKPEEETPMDPPPIPPGEPFTVAFHGLGTGIDWKIATEGAYKGDWVVESDGPPRKIYWLESQDIILIGKTNTHYIFAKLTRRMTSRKDHRVKTFFVRWEGFKLARPIEAHDLMKLAPKVIKGMREGARSMAKFSVIDGAITEDNILKQVRHSRLSFPDAALGSGLIAEGGGEAVPTGRKIQIELEPIQSREKYKAVQQSGTRKWHRAYDWFLHINGKKTQLNDREVDNLDTTYILSGVFGYDYDKKKNLTRLRGGGLKFGPKDALQQLAKALDPGAARDAVLKASEAFA